MDYQVDEIFKKNLSDIFNSSWVKGGRATWEDGSPTYTCSIFGVHNVYDLRNGFPLLTLRPINYKAAIKEILWIWQKRSSNIDELGLSIWDQWASNGKIHNCYADMLNKPTYGFSNQVDFILHEIEFNHSSRRIITDMFDPVINDKKSLEECAFLTQWNVSGCYLDLMLYQRSQDFMVANNWNVVQYSALLCMVAAHCGLKPRKFIHNIGNCHIYDRHLDQALAMLDRNSVGYNDLVLKRTDKGCFYDISVEDFVFATDCIYDPAKEGNSSLKFEVAI